MKDLASNISRTRWPIGIESCRFPNIPPYTGIDLDETRTFPNGRTFRIAVYRAYNALGLIGTESNGVAVFAVDNRSVLCDEIAKQPTGWFGPSREQLATFELLRDMSWEAFKHFINSHPRSRYKLVDPVRSIQ